MKLFSKPSADNADLRKQGRDIPLECSGERPFADFKSWSKLTLAATHSAAANVRSLISKAGARNVEIREGNGEVREAFAQVFSTFSQFTLSRLGSDAVRRGSDAIRRGSDAIRRGSDAIRRGSDAAGRGGNRIFQAFCDKLKVFGAKPSVFRLIGAEIR